MRGRRHTASFHINENWLLSKCITMHQICTFESCLDTLLYILFSLCCSDVTSLHHHVPAFLQDDYTRKDGDVILLAKEWVSSPSLSQGPVLLLPQDYCSRLTSVNLKVQMRNILPKRAVDECLDDNTRWHLLLLAETCHVAQVLLS